MCDDQREYDELETTIDLQMDSRFRLPTPNEGAVARRASLLAIAGWEIGREIEVTDDELILGRSPELPVPITTTSVSRQHAKVMRVRRKKGVVYRVVDLGSTNGTQLNGSAIQEAPLHNGDKLQMGNVVFKFLLQDPLDARFHEEVHRRIHYDQLTGLLTLDTFLLHLKTECERIAHLGEGVFTLAMTDLDGLKKVNDTYGHLTGRSVVGEMGAIMRSVLRPRDRAGLYGGDEAILLLSGVSVSEAQDIAERLRKAIRNHRFTASGTEFHVSISQGLAEFPAHGPTPDRLIAAADGALYAAKADGRDCVRVAAP